MGVVANSPPNVAVANVVRASSAITTPLSTPENVMAFLDSSTTARGLSGASGNGAIGPFVDEAIVDATGAGPESLLLQPTNVDKTKKTTA
jgi:hypothetical protein